MNASVRAISNGELIMCRAKYMNANEEKPYRFRFRLHLRFR